MNTPLTLSHLTSLCLAILYNKPPVTHYSTFRILSFLPPDSLLSLVHLALFYLARLKLTTPFSPSSLPILFLASIITAQKVLEDKRFTNSTWANLSGLPLGYVNRIERDFLTHLRYDLFVSKEEFRDWLFSLKVLIQRVHSTSSKRQEEAGIKTPPTSPVSYPV